MKTSSGRESSIEAAKVDDASYFINRELSLLGFFRRVLAMAGRDDIPLLERLRFLTITSTIVDEFFEIRVAGMKKRVELGVMQSRPDGMGQSQTLQSIFEHMSSLLEEQYRILNDTVLPELRHHGVSILRRAEWSKAQSRWIREYFEENVTPVLTPVGLDPAHPFPRLVNKSLNMIVSLAGTDAFGRSSEHAIVPVPRCLPRLIRLPTSLTQGNDEYVLLSSVIHQFVHKVFPGMKVKGCHQFRVTRNADLWVDEEEVEDLVDALKGQLFRRRYGDAVRLEVARTCPQKEVNLLQAQFGLSHRDVYRVDGPVNLHRIQKIYDLVEKPELKFAPFMPSRQQIAANTDLFDTVSRGDIVLHHPYESFSPVVDLVRQAAKDPDVLAIKQTVYRTGSDSPFVEALIEAARGGKEVTAVVELRARFDEAANIDLAHRLQDAGAHVVYGVVGFKTHAKMLMIVRREGQKLRRYVHLGTGNYHTGTAKAYTDFSLLTCRNSVGRDVHNLFMQLTGVGRAEKLEKLKQSPFTLRKWLMSRLEFESTEAQQGRKAHVIIKVNSLSDPNMIKALYKASQLGVTIELIVRGICCLRPGLPGVSDNITVRSVVGRFLEHTRIYYFYSGGKEALYCASADWMVRNLSRRVETCFPIESQELKRRVMKEGLLNYLHDTSGAWSLQSDGHYSPVLRSSNTPYCNAQSELILSVSEHE